VRALRLLRRATKAPVTSLDHRDYLLTCPHTTRRQKSRDKPLPGNEAMTPNKHDAGRYYAICVSDWTLDSGANGLDLKFARCGMVCLFTKID